MNEADTCRKLVIPALQAAGWDREPARICEQAGLSSLVSRGFAGVRPVHLLTLQQLLPMKLDLRKPLLSRQTAFRDNA
jgi:hypothetical protein